MGFGIHFNSFAAKARHDLDRALKKQSEAMKRLSSGKRINSAADDAAGLGISTRIQTDIRSRNQVWRNIQNGISFGQVAEGALGEIQNLLVRGYELGVQAASDTLSDADRRSLQAEFDQTKAQISDIAADTVVFGRRPLQTDSGPPNIKNLFGASGSTISRTSGIVSMSFIPAGSTDVTLTIDAISADDDIQVFTAEGKHLIGTDLADQVWSSKGITTPEGLEKTVFLRSNGYASEARYDASFLNSGGGAYQNPPGFATSYNGMTLTYSGDGDRSDPGDGNNDGTVLSPTEVFRVDTVTEDLIVSVVGSGAFSATATWDSIPERTLDDGMKILVETTPRGEQSYVEFERTPSDPAALGIAGCSILTAEEAQGALEALRGAMEKVSRFRGSYGAKINALESCGALTQQQKIADSGTLSRIVDADAAQESSSLLRSSIVQRAAAALLAQAQMQPQLALQLIK